MQRKKAMTEARAEIATAINAKVKSVTDSYVSSYQQGENDESKKSLSIIDPYGSGTGIERYACNFEKP